jgi:hypothetical protein
MRQIAKPHQQSPPKGQAKRNASPYLYTVTETRMTKTLNCARQPEFYCLFLSSRLSETSFFAAELTLFMRVRFTPRFFRQ